ncbi:MAG: hypothetical protein ACRDBY_12705 [Cetobacterium sp.]
MIKYQDVNIAIVERSKILEGECKYLVIGKTYLGVELNEVMDKMIALFQEDSFYVNTMLRYGLDSKTFIVVGSDFEKDVYEISNEVLVEKLRQEFLETIRENPNWIDSSNLTSEEKKTLKGVL